MYGRIPVTKFNFEEQKEEIKNAMKFDNQLNTNGGFYDK